MVFRNLQDISVFQTFSHLVFAYARGTDILKRKYNTFWALAGLHCHNLTLIIFLLRERFFNRAGIWATNCPLCV